MKPMLAKLVRELPEGDYVYEPKWDGFRCLATRDAAGAIELHSRHGRPLGRYFPEIVAALDGLGREPWTLDGELLVLAGGSFDFAALMARLHPAPARVQRLASETPGIYVAFDAPADEPFADRRARLEALVGGAGPPLFVTPATDDRALAQRWLDEFRGGGLDGVIAKPLHGRYEPGVRAMLKVKHERTADCVLAGVRAGAEPFEVVSLMLGLYDDRDRLEHIGVVSSFARAERARLTHELAPLVTELAGHPWEEGFLLGGGPMGRLKGAAGRWRPGMPIDWIPLRPERVCEVSYTQVDARRLRHPAKLVRWRPDREPPSCRIEQLDEPVTPPAQVLSGANRSP